MTEAFLFDLDGTLVDTLEDITASVNATLKNFGFQVLDKLKVRDCIGDGIVKLIERVMPRLGGAELDDALLFYRAEYARRQFDNTRPYEGIVGVLEELRRKGKKIAVVTNKREAAACELVDRYFGNLVDITIGDDFLRPLKPDPAPLKYALERLGVVEEKAYFVGDSEIDMMAAERAGIRSIGVTWGYRERELLLKHKASELIDSPQGLLKYIDKD